MSDDLLRRAAPLFEQVLQVSTALNEAVPKIRQRERLQVALTTVLQTWMCEQLEGQQGILLRKNYPDLEFIIAGAIGAQLANLAQSLYVGGSNGVALDVNLKRWMCPIINEAFDRVADIKAGGEGDNFGVKPTADKRSLQLQSFDYRSHMKAADGSR